MHSNLVHGTLSGRGNGQSSLLAYQSPLGFYFTIMPPYFFPGTSRYT